MAATEIRVTKKGSTRPVLTLVRGDERTHRITMIVQRYYGDVDLAPLAWSVVVRNSAGTTDTFYIPNAAVDDTAITVDWVVRGAATLADGDTLFELEGMAQDGEKTYIWQSGTYVITVTEDINHAPGEDEQAQLTEVQELIVYVNSKLPDVIQAGEMAANAASDATEAVKSIPTAVTNAVGDLVFSINNDGYLVVE